MISLNYGKLKTGYVWHSYGIPGKGWYFYNNITGERKFSLLNTKEAAMDELKGEVQEMFNKAGV